MTDGSLVANATTVGNPTTADEIEAAFVAGAARALRRRAERQRDVAKAHGDRAGETVIALRIGDVLDALATEFEHAPKV
jgi:hypothetical protein